MKSDRRGNESKAGIKDYLGYMCGDAGNLFVLTYVSSFLKIFYTDILKIPAAKAATLFLASRLWDAVNDPIWGGIVAKRKAKPDGKYRPYLKTIALPLAVSEALCFLPIVRVTQSERLILLFAYVTYILFGMLYTGINVPYGSLAGVISSDKICQTKLSAFRNIGSGIGAAAPMLLAPLLIYTKVPDSSGNIVTVASEKGMFLFAVVMAAFSVTFYYISYGNTRERVKTDACDSVNLTKVYKSLFKSRPFIALALTGVLISGLLQFASLNQYLYKNYFCNTNLTILGTIAQYFPVAVLIPFTPKLVAKFGKKKLCSVGSFFSAVTAIAVALIKPGPGQSVLFMLSLFLIGFGFSVVSVTNWAVVTDVIDYQYNVTGIRNESAVYAIYTFCRKLGQTAADYCGLMLLDRAGYNAEKMGAAIFIPGVSEKILSICTVIPAIAYFAVFVLYTFVYPIED